MRQVRAHKRHINSRGRVGAVRCGVGCAKAGESRRGGEGLGAEVGVLKCHINRAWSGEAVRSGVGYHDHAIELHPQSPFARLPLPLATLACPPPPISIAPSLLSMSPR